MAPESGVQEPGIPACPPLHTLQSRGHASSENKKGAFKPLTLCLRSVWGRHHPTCARAALGLGPRSAAMSVRCPRKCIGRRVAPPRLLAECPRTSQCRAPQDPPGILPAASGGRLRAPVPSAGSRTTQRSGGLSPGWMQSRAPPPRVSRPAAPSLPQKQPQTPLGCCVER